MPFIIIPSYNSKDSSELTGRNKIEIAQTAEKRLNQAGKYRKEIVQIKDMTLSDDWEKQLKNNAKDTMRKKGMLGGCKKLPGHSFTRTTMA